MRHFFGHFIKDETGAVTVDWVVLTAAVVGLAVTLVLTLEAGSMGVSAGVEQFMTDFF